MSEPVPSLTIDVFLDADGEVMKYQWRNEPPRIAAALGYLEVVKAMIIGEMWEMWDSGNEETTT